MKTNQLQVKSFETGEVVKTVDVSSHTEREVERILSGMLRVTDTDRFYIAEVSA